MLEGLLIGGGIWDDSRGVCWLKRDHKYTNCFTGLLGFRVEPATAAKSIPIILFVAAIESEDGQVKFSLSLNSSPPLYIQNDLTDPDLRDIKVEDTLLRELLETTFLDNQNVRPIPTQIYDESTDLTIQMGESFEGFPRHGDHKIRPLYIYRSRESRISDARRGWDGASVGLDSAVLGDEPGDDAAWVELYPSDQGDELRNEVDGDWDLDSFGLDMAMRAVS